MTLSDEQSAAVETIHTSERGIFYVYGITGSGKTEVYLRAAGMALAEEKSVIYLVPEIFLTHQIIDTVQKRFSRHVAVLHSHLTPSQKLSEWKRIASGEARFVIGARSAVFAPARNIGLIVLDEEHEGSYKAGSAPRYHARQVAMYRCKQSGAKLVMGSATPSLEAYHLMQEGKLIRLSLNRRLAGGSVPSIAVVDMKRERGSFSKLLIEEIKKTHNEGRQAILFLNRRGFAYFFHCKTCGYEMTCKNCSVSLTYHKSRERMICHYCGYSLEPISVCPECGSLDVGYSGFGTEKIEAEMVSIFPNLNIRRIDTDTAGKRGASKKLIKEFSNGKIDLLLGTQMVAKGLNFPGVKLVGIVLADTSLMLPDFRAAERTFALVVQVSGRAGRYFPDGKVIIQTYRPHISAIRCAARGDFRSFYEEELEVRKALGFPPFTRIIRIVFRGRDAEKVEKTARVFSTMLKQGQGGGTQTLGPAECPISVIAGNYRFQLIVKAAVFGKAHATVKAVTDRFHAPKGVHIEIDVDPVSLL